MRKLVIFGTGSGANKISRKKLAKVAYFLDNNPEKWGKTFRNKPILSPAHLQKEEKKKIHIIICSMFYADITNQLISLGLNARNISVEKSLKVKGEKQHFHMKLKIALLYLRWRLRGVSISIGKGTKIGKNVTFSLSQKSSLVVGENCNIENDAEIRTNSGGNIRIGNNCILEKGSILSTYGGNIELGNHVSINPYCILYGHGGLAIGDNVRIATHTVIVPSNHNFRRFDIPIKDQGLTNKGINIHEDVWIGANVTILDGVTIFKGCVIGAGSVVTKNLEEGWVYAGAPAKKIKSRMES